jgi:glyoxylate/hydroxypyruvate reductase A
VNWAKHSAVRQPILAIYATTSRADWWQSHLQSLLPELDCRLWDNIDTPEAVEYAVVWSPPQGWLAGFDHLRCIVSIGAGIDHVLADEALPDHVPIIRTTGDDLTQRMREYVCLHVLAQHRQLFATRTAQSEGQWQPLITPPASELTVGIMGLGKLGSNAASSLAHLGYRVVGWAQQQHTIEGVCCYHKTQLDQFLEQCNLLVCLLPLTPHTRGILNASLFSKLKTGAGLINVARGDHLIEQDLIEALDSGQLSHATLDVFQQEPLPEDHPFWHHPDITITPHIASLIDPVSGGKEIARNLKDFMQGRPVADLTDRSRGY